MADKKLTLEDLAAQVANLENRLEDLASNMAPSNAKPATAEAPKVPADVFEVDKKKFQFSVARYITPDGVTVNAADMLNNPAELERLVTIKSGIIKAAK